MEDSHIKTQLILGSFVMLYILAIRLMTEKRTNKINELAVKQNGLAFQLIPEKERTDKVIEFAVK